MQAPVSVIHAIDRLSVNSDFQMLVGYLRLEKDAAIRQLLDGANTVSVHKSQGYTQALVDVLELATTSKEVLSALG